MSDPPGRLAALTGGTGFLGRYIALALDRAGWRLRLLVRSEPVHPQTAHLEPEIVLGDLLDDRALRRLCRGADAVIHAAGLIRARDRAAFFAVNEGGSARLAAAAAEAAPGAPLIVVSSLAAREPGLSDYAASKRAGEEAVLRAAAGPVTVLRPPVLYGPWDRETLALFRAAAR
ncbi:MAG TPA: NAD-dependent epimerase/dehydratase family protein, partial [Thermohalobaculum sp.]|nr:NAD-dependent epimerase/dehydratase family protein [Thermohalobaculum sp.]